MFDDLNGDEMTGKEGVCEVCEAEGWVFDDFGQDVCQGCLSDYLGVHVEVDGDGMARPIYEDGGFETPGEQIDKLESDLKKLPTGEYFQRDNQEEDDDC